MIPAAACNPEARFGRLAKLIFALQVLQQLALPGEAAAQELTQATHSNHSLWVIGGHSHLKEIACAERCCFVAVQGMHSRAIHSQAHVAV